MQVPDNNNQKDSNIKSTIDAVAGLAKAIPIYGDVVQPAAKEIGKSLATVAKTINIALTPISLLVWGYDKIKDYVLERVSEKLKDVPQDKIVTPDPAIVGPSLEALRFLGNDTNLRELFASLIATAMNLDQINNAHPGFVEILKNLSSEEALILTYLHRQNKSIALMDFKLKIVDNEGDSDCFKNISTLGQHIQFKSRHLLPNYIDNLSRLGLTEIPFGRVLIANDVYQEIEDSVFVKEAIKYAEELNRKLVPLKKYMILTGFGEQFCKACITM